MAQFHGVCGVGESVYMWERGLVNNERCGCGRAFAECPFWQEVGDVAFGGWHQVDPERLRELRAQVDDVKYVPAILMGWESATFRRRAREYVGYYERLYAGVQAVAGSDVIVDSSKVTSLAYLLARYSRFDVSLIHILRDPRAVAYSWTKVVRRPEITSGTAYMPRYSPLYMAALYSGHHVLLEALRTKRVPVLNVAYEDFADDPMRELRRVADFAGLQWDADRLEGEVPGTLRLDVVHTASGNPSRFATGEIEVRRDDSWRRAFTRANVATVSAVTAPLMLAYRYPRTQAPTTASEPAGAGGAAESEIEWPAVTAIIPTHNRPELVRRAIASVVAQDYPGELSVIVVFDQAPIDASLSSESPTRPVVVTANTARTPGLAGARNTGIQAAQTPWVAFLDDDDHWTPDKLRRQMRATLADPDCLMSTTATAIERDGETLVRLADRRVVTYQELLRSRLSMLHSSSFLIRREALLGEIGLVDETMPRSMAEDWDLLLRAAKQRPITHVDEPLVRVTWGATSYFADQWRLRNEARLWMLKHHPDFKSDRRGAGLMYGKLAFGHAILGERRAAATWTHRALRANWKEPRTPLAVLVALGLVRGSWVVEQLGKRGRGI